MEVRMMLNAAKEGDTLTVRKLLRKYVVDVNVCDEVGTSALARAAQAGSLEIVKLLVDSGAKVNVVDGAYVTPLHLAAKGKHLEVVKFLILNGSVVEAKTKSGLRPIDFVPYYCRTWEILRDAANKEMPEMENYSEVPIISDYAIAYGTKNKTSSKKKGKKKSGKKGGKKKGKKRK